MTSSLRALYLCGSLLAVSSGLSACGGAGSGNSDTVAPTSQMSAPDTVAHTPAVDVQTPEGAGPYLRNSVIIRDEAMAARFLNRATFGASQADIDAMIGQSAAQWMQAEFAKPASYILPPLATQFEAGVDLNNRVHSTEHWDNVVTADDQLRQRMVFALSQIVVYSDTGTIGFPLTSAHYIDILSENAFGNYRDVLDDVTYSPAMARYLTYLRNVKGDDNTGRQPDENYAREILQLFTIGLNQLNMYGEVKRDGNRKPIETYDNDDIVGLARVFTGLSFEGGFRNADADTDGHYSRLVAYADKHSPKQKDFLGKTIAAGTSADSSITQALDHIFAHDNVAPFISTQLIQRFTSSSPQPDYVFRVASAFETGYFKAIDGTEFGSGVKGDLQATLAAILLDEQFFEGVPADITRGKVREPVLKFAQFARAFNMQDVNAANERLLAANARDKDQLSQDPFRAPSVFNFYRPGFIAPNTETGNADLTAPEFQIVNEGGMIGYYNFMLDFVMDRSGTYDDTVTSYTPDYSAQIALADDADALADNLDLLLLSGRMSAQTRTRMIDIINKFPVGTADPAADRLKRVQVAVYTAVTSPDYAVDL